MDQKSNDIYRVGMILWVVILFGAALIAIPLSHCPRLNQPLSPTGEWVAGIGWILVSGIIAFLISWLISILKAKKKKEG